MQRLSVFPGPSLVLLVLLAGPVFGQESPEDPFVEAFYAHYYEPRLGEGFVPVGFWREEAARISTSQAITALRSGAGYFSTVTDRFVGLLLSAPGDPASMEALQAVLGSEAELVGLATDLGFCDDGTAVSGGCSSEAMSWLGSLSTSASVVMATSPADAGVKLADLLLEQTLMAQVRANLRLDRLKLITLARRFTLAEQLYALYEKAGRGDLSAEEARALMRLEQQYFQVRQDSYALDAQYWQDELKPQDGVIPFTTHTLMDFFPGYDDPEQEQANLDFALAEAAGSVDERMRCEALYRATLRAAGETTAAERDNAAALFAAVEADDAAEVDRLLYLGYDPDPEAPQGYTPLMRAIGLGRAAIARLLMEGGADVNAVDAYGRSVLDFACCFQALGEEDQAGIVDGLIQRGADPSYVPPHLNVCNVPDHEWYQAFPENCPDHVEWPGVHCLVLNGRSEALRAWVDAGAPLDEARDPYGGTTVLGMTAAQGNAEAAEVLLKGGANPNAVNWMGLAMLVHAIPTPIDRAETAAGKAVVAQRLLAAGAVSPTYSFWADLGLDPSMPENYAVSFQQAQQKLVERNTAMAYAQLMQEQEAYARQEAEREAYWREVNARNQAARRAQIQRRMDAEARRSGETPPARTETQPEVQPTPQRPAGASGAIWWVQASFTSGCFRLDPGGRVSFENGGASCDESGRFGAHQYQTLNQMSFSWSHAGSQWRYTQRWTQEGTVWDVRCTASAAASARSLEWNCQWAEAGAGARTPTMRWERRY